MHNDYEEDEKYEDNNNLTKTTKYVVDSETNIQFFNTLEEAKEFAEDGDMIAEIKNVKKVKVEKKLV